MRSFTACTYSKPYIVGDKVKEEYGTHETENEYIRDKILTRKSEGKRELGRSRCSWGIRLTSILN